jgi:hypothetical protein
MKTFIPILHLEDNPHDDAMTFDRLEADGLTCNITLVQTREASVPPST